MSLRSITCAGRRTIGQDKGLFLEDLAVASGDLRLRV